MALDLKQIYHAATAEEAESKLAEFEARWDANPNTRAAYGRAAGLFFGQGTGLLRC